MRLGAVGKAVALATAMTGMTIGALFGPHAIAPAAAATDWLATRAYFNDPRAKGAASNVTRNLITHHFDRAISGSIAQVTTWELTDTAISNAMIRALGRGVTVRVILASRNCDAAAAQQLRAAVRSHAGLVRALRQRIRPQHRRHDAPEVVHLLRGRRSAGHHNRRFSERHRGELLRPVGRPVSAREPARRVRRVHQACSRSSRPTPICAGRTVSSPSTMAALSSTP